MDRWAGKRVERDKGELRQREIEEEESRGEGHTCEQGVGRG